MPRVFRPIRLFVEKDGRRKPSLFFFIFFFWILAALFMLAHTLLTQHAQRSAAAAYLSRTPTPTHTSSPTASSTPTPTVTPTPSNTSTPTPFVYSDPATWELIEVEQEDGSIKLELQDWQKAEIRHFFEEYYNLAWRSQTGMPELEQVLGYLIDPAADYYQNDLFPELIRRGIFLEYPSTEHLFIYIRYLPEHSEVWGGFRVEVVLVNPINWETRVHNAENGELIKIVDYGPVENRYQLTFEENIWKVYLTSIANQNPQ